MQPVDQAERAAVEAAPRSAGQLRVERLTYQAGGLDLDLSLECERWPLVLLGPSGAGKTVFLRLLAGLEKPREGRIELNGRVWYSSAAGINLPPFRRPIGYCLQDPLLFPHLTVLENVAYPLGSVRPSVPRRERDARAREELERWGAGALAGAGVNTLSGGEQGRVGLARAFVRPAELLLLDEPLAALDPPSREKLWALVRKELLRFPAVWVTHDRNEAFLIGETVAVLLNGRLAQVGPPEEIFRRPAGPEVAGFVGVGTVLHGLVQARESGIMRIRCGPAVLRAVGNFPPGTPVVATIRSEEIELVLPEPQGDAPPASLTSARNELPATVISVRPLGMAFLVELDAGVALTAAVTRPAVEELALSPGRQVHARIKALGVQVRSEAWER